MTSRKNENDLLFVNMKEWKNHYSAFSDYFTGELERIIDGKPKTRNEKATHDKLFELAIGLIKGACRLQYVGDRGFYHENDELEVLIHFKKDYNLIPLKSRVDSLIDDILILLESEQIRLEEIASYFDEE